MATQEPLSFVDALLDYGLAVRHRWLVQSNNRLPAPPVGRISDPVKLRARALAFQRFTKITAAASGLEMTAAYFADLPHHLPEFASVFLTTLTAMSGGVIGTLSNLAGSTNASDLIDVVVGERAAYMRLVTAAKDTFGDDADMNLRQHVTDFIDDAVAQLQGQDIDPNTVEEWLFPYGREGVSLLLDDEARLAYNDSSQDLKVLLARPSQANDLMSRLLDDYVSNDDLSPSIAAAGWRYLEAVTARLNATLPDAELLLPTSHVLYQNFFDGRSVADGIAEILEQRQSRTKDFLGLQGVGLTVNLASIVSGLSESGWVVPDQPWLIALVSALPFQLVLAHLTLTKQNKTFHNAANTDSVRRAARHEVNALADLIHVVNERRVALGQRQLLALHPPDTKFLVKTLIAAGLPALLVETTLSDLTMTLYRQAAANLAKDGHIPVSQEILDELADEEPAPPTFDSVILSREPAEHEMPRWADAPGLHDALATAREAFDTVAQSSLAKVTASADPKVTALLTGIAGQYPQLTIGQGDQHDVNDAPIIERTLRALSQQRVLRTLVRTAQEHPSVDAALAGLPMVAPRAAVTAIELGVAAPALAASLDTALGNDDASGRAAWRFMSQRARVVARESARGRRAVDALIAAAADFATTNGQDGFGAALQAQNEAFATQTPSPTTDELSARWIEEKGAPSVDQRPALEEILRSGRAWTAHRAALERSAVQEIRGLSHKQRLAFAQRLRVHYADAIPSPILQAAIDGDDPPAPGTRPTHGPDLPKPQSGPGGTEPPTTVTAPPPDGRTIRAGGAPSRKRWRHGPRNAATTPSRLEPTAPAIAEPARPEVATKPRRRPQARAGRRVTAVAATQRAHRSGQCDINGQRGNDKNATRPMVTAPDVDGRRQRRQVDARYGLEPRTTEQPTHRSTSRAITNGRPADMARPALPSGRSTRTMTAGRATPPPRPAVGRNSVSSAGGRGHAAPGFVSGP